MQVARAGVGVAEGRIREATADALPQIKGVVSYNHKFDSIFRGLSGADSSGLGKLFSATPFGAEHGWNVDVTATQLLWSSGRVGAGLQAAHAVRRSATSQRDQTMADVTLAVHEAYWAALAAQQVVTIARDGRDQAREHLRQVESYRRQGSRSEYDLLQAQVDASNQEPPLVAARSAAELALLQLKRALGLRLDQPLALDTPLAFRDTLPVTTSGPDDASARPAVKGADAIVEARQAAVRAERAARWPQLLATATVSHQAFPADGTPTRSQFHRSIDATLRLDWPIFQGLRTFGTVQRATNELAEARAQRDALRQAAEVELAQARLGVDEALATLLARRGTARLATRAYQLAEVRWRNGLSTQLEVSDARLQMQNAQVNEVLAVKDYRLSLARLERAAGRPLATVNRSFDELTLDSTPREDR
jgi:outer membrane protein TolC